MSLDTNASTHVDASFSFLPDCKNHCLDMVEEVVQSSWVDGVVVASEDHRGLEMLLLPFGHNAEKAGSAY
jgi:hypothetical protein